MRWNYGMVAIALLLSCNKDKDDDSDIVPLDADADADTDTDTDTDTDADTDTEPAGLCAPLPPASGTLVSVSDTDDLAAEIAAAAAGSTLLLADGTYTVTGPLVIDKALTLRGATDDASAVVIDADREGTHLIEITASDVTLAYLTLQNSYDHLVYVHPQGAAVSGTTLTQLRLIDAGRYAVVVEGDGADNWVDDGQLTCSHIELTNDGRIDIRGGCDTGGIDAYGTRGWDVTDNFIDSLWCDPAAAGPGIRFWRGARDTLITRNVLSDVAKGIVLGETRDQIGREYADDPCGDTIVQHIDGMVANNIVFGYSQTLLDSGPGIEIGIRAEASCNASILHNNVYAGITPDASIDHRYDTTTGVIANNLASHTVRRLDDSALVADQNLENVSFDTWLFPAGGDFHLSPAAKWAIDLGVTTYLPIVPNDIDDEPRDDGLPDIGADEI